MPPSSSDEPPAPDVEQAGTRERATAHSSVTVLAQDAAQHKGNAQYLVCHAKGRRIHADQFEIGQGYPAAHGHGEHRNPLHAKTGGCRDGLMADGINQNEGAESTLAWLLSLMRLQQLYVDEVLKHPSNHFNK